jgi:hypothetical protein
MDLEAYIERVEQYETGTLSSEGRAAFERDLAADAALREALDLYRQANDAIEVGIENRLRDQLQSWAAEAPAAARPAAVVRPLFTVWRTRAVAAAAAVALLLLGWFGYRSMERQYTDEALFAAYYEVPQAATQRGGADANLLDRGLAALERGDAAEAAAMFEAVPPGDARYGEARYDLGHAALALRQYDRAIAAFAAARSDARIGEKAAWNQALTYLAAGRADDPDFRTLLQEIASDRDHSYAAQAAALDRKLDAFWR